MKIEMGTAEDYHHCIAIKHEYFKCRDAFEQFRKSAESLILSGYEKQKSYRAYNSYSYFIHHLYEFLLACHARDYENSNITNKKGPERIEFLDSLITEDTYRVVKARIDRIKQGRAPSHENDISHYEQLLPIPELFALDFRVHRNKLAGHASYERTKNFNLTNFYEKYHFYLYLLYVDVGDSWGRQSTEFPEFEDVTNFMRTMVRK
ncbi:hypothetical protein [Rheinheimera sp. EpRS3]|uniref:hypothetical protein n=1 Tax=Rheinheimera sp. EpRS3 TaxID=1712383 RepID=UPI000749AFA5|nr:hypothetical protein [Rheinheimera sp. EpRS3]KUM54036.1 hypothetical protein AR688_11840 [Rheinheimera sp. EpRS3]